MTAMTDGNAAFLVNQRHKQSHKKLALVLPGVLSSSDSMHTGTGEEAVATDVPRKQYRT